MIFDDSAERDADGELEEVGLGWVGLGLCLRMHLDANSGEALPRCKASALRRTRPTTASPPPTSLYFAKHG